MPVGTSLEGGLGSLVLLAFRVHPDQAHCEAGSQNRRLPDVRGSSSLRRGLVGLESIRADAHPPRVTPFLRSIIIVKIHNTRHDQIRTDALQASIDWCRARAGARGLGCLQSSPGTPGAIALVVAGGGVVVGLSHALPRLRMHENIHPLPRALGVLVGPLAAGAEDEVAQSSAKYEAVRVALASSDGLDASDGGERDRASRRHLVWGLELRQRTRGARWARARWARARWARARCAQARA